MPSFFAKILVLVCFAVAKPGLGQSLSKISGSYINGDMSYLVSSEDLIPYDLITSLKDQFTSPAPHNFRPSDDTVWLLYQLSYDQNESSNVIIFDKVFPLTDYIRLYHYNEDGVLIQQFELGDRLPFKNRNISFRTPAIKVELIPGENIFLFQVQNVGPMITATRIWTYADFSDYMIMDYIILSACLGGIFVIGIYNFFLYFMVRDKTYLYYFAYIVFLTFFSMNVHGLSIHFDPSRNHESWLLNQGVFAGGDLTVMFTGLFAIHFLNMKKHMPLFFYAISISVAVCFLSLIGHTIFGNTHSLKVLTILNGAAMSTMLLITAFIASLRGYRPAYFFLFGFTLLLVGQINLSAGMLGLFEYNTWTLWGYFFGGTVEGIILSFALGYRINLMRKKEAEERDKKDHYYKQMEKVFYPHQLALMQTGKALEETMPTTRAEACVIAFDIVNSTQIGHIEHHYFFESVLKKCQILMNGKSDASSQNPVAFRIKEVGDGFLCSIGFPFKNESTASLETSAYQLALQFIDIFRSEVKLHFGHHDFHCAAGIAKGEVMGYFPSSGTKEYDLFGDSIIHATRYEAMRKVLFPEPLRADVLILQEAVYHGLTANEKTGLKEVDLKARNLTVRDDPKATKLFYHSFPAPSQRHDGDKGVIDLASFRKKA